MSEKCNYKDEKEKLTIAERFLGMLVVWIQATILYVVDNLGLSKVLGYFGLQLRPLCEDSQSDHKRKHDLVDQSSDEEPIQQVKMLRADEDQPNQEAKDDQKDTETTKPIQWNSLPDLNFVASLAPDLPAPVNPFVMVKDVLAKHYKSEGTMVSDEDHTETSKDEENAESGEEAKKDDHKEEKAVEGDFDEEIKGRRNGIENDQEDEEEFNTKNSELKTDAPNEQEEDSESFVEEKEAQVEDEIPLEEGEDKTSFSKEKDDQQRDEVDAREEKENTDPLEEGKENVDPREDARYTKDENSNYSPSKIENTSASSKPSPIKWLRSILKNENSGEKLKLPSPNQRKPSECIDASQMLAGRRNTEDSGEE